MWNCLGNLWTALTRFVDCVSQAVLGWFGKDRRSVKIATERQIAGQAHLDLTRIRTTGYATNTQAEIALQNYRSHYQAITLPEVRRDLPAAAGLTIVRVGDAWRIMDPTTARTILAAGHRQRAGRHHRRTVDAWLVR